jgi:hypothetical protein
MGLKTLRLRDNQQKTYKQLRSKSLGLYGIICVLTGGVGAKF